MNIVITGASKGIGLAVAEVFAAEGHTLLLCSRGEKNLYDAVAGLQFGYPQCTVKARPADMSDAGEAKVFGEWCLEQGTPDILVNNAGQFLPGSIYSETEGTLETMMAANVYSAYRLTRLLLPSMMAAGKGHIFNICSIASLHAYANGGSYSISKFALLGFSKNLREELKPHHIKVTAVCPGATMTASWDGAGIDPARIMEAADIARMIHAAASLSPMADVEDIIMRPQLGDL
ncbi:SDR family oxidoreductase [Sediminibacterium soli]|uniref:SDR family oxidoreductase n=1 Tax=Sediminibacterium soli TaxID=2698829 RepID=UPI00137A0DAF|nr:SDR family oxidoreductase [Sediminibacterium soli]NCI47672.1 SDR family oxidoreductase [Sediminibacterium soli]